MKTINTPSIGIVVTTHEWPEALDLFFNGLSKQTVTPSQVIVAEDGVQEETSNVVRTWSTKLPSTIHHVQQEHHGFRVARIRNKALSVCTTDYVLFIDGDMIPHERFVEDHFALARSGSWAQGVRLLANESTTKRMLGEGLTSLKPWESGIDRRRHAVRSPLLARFIASRLSSRQRSIRGCNQGFWRNDLVKVNGWNETMVGWGHEDVELAVRLSRSGVKQIQVRFAALATHLHHERRVPRGHNPNEDILKATLNRDTIVCSSGLESHLVETAET